MSAPSRLPLSLVVPLILPWPALAHPGVPHDPSSQLLHVVSHPDHLAVLAGLGVLALGLAIVALRRRAPSRRPAKTREHRSS
jgi:hydrogenase/urease accessory protein HupE